MSLRKSPELTPELLAAAQNNAQHSTGPHSEAAKLNSKFNALKHGERSQPQNHLYVMLALGEDPQEFDFLKDQLMTSFGPGDALWKRLIDDLARLHWRSQRMERARDGLMRRAMLAVEEGQRRHRQEVANATFGPEQPEMLEVCLSPSADAGVRLRRTLSVLEVVRAQAEQRNFCSRQYATLEPIYQGSMGWRVARICRLLRLFSDPAQLTAPPQADGNQKSETPGPTAPTNEAKYQELLRLLDEEIAHVREEFEYAEMVNEEKAAIDRDAALFPAGETWNTLVRKQSALDRSIDRKVRILMAMRKDYANDGFAGLPGDGYDKSLIEEARLLGRKLPSQAPPAEEGVGAVCEPSPRPTPPANIKFDERSGNVYENKGPANSGTNGDGCDDEAS